MRLSYERTNERTVALLTSKADLKERTADWAEPQSQA